MIKRQLLSGYGVWRLQQSTARKCSHRGRCVPPLNASSSVVISLAVDPMASAVSGRP